MLSVKSILRISLILGIVSWILYAVADTIVLFANSSNVSWLIHPVIPKILLDIFILSIFTFYRFSVGRAESVNFIDLLWRVFVTDLLSTVVSILLRSILLALGDKHAENFVLLNFFHHINLGLIIAFLISTFVVWKRLILYQKTKFLITFWKIFQYALISSVFLNLLNIEFGDMIFLSTLIFLLSLGLFLSANLKWIAYLNFRQKWKSILFILLVMIYLGYHVLYNLKHFQDNELNTDLLSNVFILALLGFIFLYSVFSLLVILFNLPTSSVFEQKIEEAINFQRLSQSIPTGQNEEQVYHILIESSVSAVFADAAWLEVVNEDGLRKSMIRNRISQDEVVSLRKEIENSSLQYLFQDGQLNQHLNPMKLTANLTDNTHKSIMVVPLTIQQDKIGNLVLLKELGDGFNKEMVDIIKTFVNQASISIENFRLLTAALDNERYKEELKIAKRVQRSLLPAHLENNEHYEMVGFSEAADEVGGDYYDTFRIDEFRLAVVIGDVSGKGTSAAFNMSQMKGVFHSLAQLGLGPLEFLVRANNALSACLEKTSFITASYFIIDTADRTVEFARAGHCPTLYYNHLKTESIYFRNKGLGLGILRNSNFHKYVQTNKFYYHSGDVIMLYTDGITEAKNTEEEEFGYDRLQQVLMANVHKNPEEVKSAIIKALFDFCGNESLDDDYTLLIIKFR